jgi:hypothetical protein
MKMSSLTKPLGYGKRVVNFSQMYMQESDKLVVNAIQNLTKLPRYEKRVAKSS